MTDTPESDQVPPHGEQETQESLRASALHYLLRKYNAIPLHRSIDEIRPFPAQFEEAIRYWMRPYPEDGMDLERGPYHPDIAERVFHDGWVAHAKKCPH